MHTVTDNRITRSHQLGLELAEQNNDIIKHTIQYKYNQMI